MQTVPEALQLAEQALRSGDLARAQFIYERVLQKLPAEPSALNGMGGVAYRNGQLEAAEGYIRRAINAQADEAAFHNNLSLVYRRQRRFAEAIACCRRAVELAPTSPEMHNSLAISLNESGDLAGARRSLEHALSLRPDYPDALYNLGNVLSQLHCLDEAEAAYKRSIQLAPHDAEAHNNLGAAIQLRGRFDEAMQCIEQALRCRPDLASAHRNRGMLRLALGDWRGAWDDYEWRWRMPEAIAPSFSKPRWQGESLAGRTILLWGEQGFGDLIQFVRFATAIKQRGARVLLECSPKLHALLRTAPDVDGFIDTATEGERFDCYIPLLSVPSVLQTTIETIPGKVPYLFADRQLVELWRARLSEHREFKVGISWQGNPEFSGDYYRSVPLACFAPLAACQGVKLFSLQKNDVRPQLAESGAALGIVDLGTSIDEGTGAFVETAAVMMNLDLVITTDTAMAHLAGALGVPVWVALALDPNWRWLLDRSDSPFYPSMRLFRQSKFHDWTSVFAQLASELAALSTRAR